MCLTFETDEIFPEMMMHGCHIPRRKPQPKMTDAVMGLNLSLSLHSACAYSCRLVNCRCISSVSFGLVCHMQREPAFIWHVVHVVKLCSLFYIALIWNITVNVAYFIQDAILIPLKFALAIQILSNVHVYFVFSVELTVIASDNGLPIAQTSTTIITITVRVSPILHW